MRPDSKIQTQSTLPAAFTKCICTCSGTSPRARHITILGYWPYLSNVLKLR
jgi:hypothetical protein